MLVVVGVALAVAGLVILLVGKLANDGRIGRNHLLGIRTKATMASNDAWRAAHEAAWPSLFWAGITATVIGLFLAALEPGRGDAIALVGIGIFAVVMLVVAATRQAMRAAARVGPDTA